MDKETNISFLIQHFKFFCADTNRSWVALVSALCCIFSFFVFSCYDFNFLGLCSPIDKAGLFLFPLGTISAMLAVHNIYLLCFECSAKNSSASVLHNKATIIEALTHNSHKNGLKLSIKISTHDFSNKLKLSREEFLTIISALTKLEEHYRKTEPVKIPNQFVQHYAE